MYKCIILVEYKNNSKAILTLCENVEGKINTIFKTKAFIGKNGIASDKCEGDKKTPKGVFYLSKAFGLLKDPRSKLEYLKVNKNNYFVDDENSKYYNKMVNILNVEKDWIRAEHLVKFRSQYKYAIIIDYNKKCIKGDGSAIFLHCSKGKPTAGCIAIAKKYMLKLLRKVDKETIIIIV
ncbi:MAG: L,D-transpeptidase family protein [Clostridia bacterium]